MNKIYIFAALCMSNALFAASHGTTPNNRAKGDLAQVLGYGLVMNNVIPVCEKASGKKFRMPVGIASTAVYKTLVDLLARKARGKSTGLLSSAKILGFRAVEEAWYRGLCAGVHSSEDSPDFLKHWCPKSRSKRAAFLSLRRFCQWCTEDVLKWPLSLFIKPKELKQQSDEEDMNEWFNEFIKGIQGQQPEHGPENE